MELKTYLTAFGNAQFDIGELVAVEGNRDQLTRRRRQSKKFFRCVLEMHSESQAILMGYREWARHVEEELDGALVLPKK